MRHDSDRPLTIALLLSLAIHLFLFSYFTLPKAIQTARDELEVLLEGKRIVDIARPEQEIRPKTARFLGLYDSEVREERVAPTPFIPPSRRRIVTGPDGRDLPKKAGEGIRLAAKPPEKSVPERELGDDLASILPEEFFPDIKIGNRTYLNVLRYPKIAYFVELKQKFKLTWNPQPAVMQYLFMNFPHAGTLETTVAFKIDRQGNLRGAWIQRASGLDSYDEEALRTVLASAPFSSPPDHLLSFDGTRDDILQAYMTFVAIL